MRDFDVNKLCSYSSINEFDEEFKANILSGFTKVLPKKYSKTILRTRNIVLFSGYVNTLVCSRLMTKLSPLINWKWLITLL
jgi:hypothetical protein